MDIGNTGLAGRAVTQVPHIKLSCKRKVCLGKKRIVQFAGWQIFVMLMNGCEYLGNGSCA